MTNVKNTRIPAVSAEIDGMALTLTFATGNKLHMDAGMLTKEIVNQATMHGLKQKLIDAAAIARNTDTGASATVRDKFDAVKAVFDRLLGGDWNTTRASGEGPTRGSLLLLALQRFQPERSVDDLIAFLDGLTPEQKKGLGLNPKILTHIQAIQAERAEIAAKRSGVDSDDLLASLLD